MIRIICIWYLKGMIKFLNKQITHQQSLLDSGNAGIIDIMFIKDCINDFNKVIENINKTINWLERGEI